MPDVLPSENEKSLPNFSTQQLQTLDPADWEGFRTQAHRMLDDILGYTKDIRQRPVWQPIPDDVRQRFHAAIPLQASPLAEVHQEFMQHILPFAVGNVHPGFMGWVHGGGTPVGMLAEMLAAGLNANLGGRDQVPIEVERQVARWMQAIFGFPASAAGLFVTGTSMANFIAVIVARDAELGDGVRREGVAAKAKTKTLTAYASTAVHGCIAKAMDLCGLGSDALRLVPTDKRGRINLIALEEEISKDRAAGFHPFMVVGTAGTVDTGAIEDLAGLADLARRETLWFHVDGAYGALAVLAHDLAPKLRGIERADSLAFDFHKWGQVPYDVGFLLVRDGALQRNAFAASAAYLQRETRGLAARSPWPCDYGPDLSRGFRALKTWFTLKVYGTQALGAVISQTCALARYLEQRIASTPELELLAPVELNVVCFRYRADDADRVNRSIVVELQESGSVAPSTTVIDGRLAIRAAIVNHRTGTAEIDRLVDDTLALGRSLTNSAAKVPAPQPIAAVTAPRVKWEAELHQIEGRLQSAPESIDLRFRRAFLLLELGRPIEARSDYIRVLQALERHPYHVAALNNLGRTLVATGHRSAARLAYKEAVARHPDDLPSRINLGMSLFEESEMLEAQEKTAEAQQLVREARDHFEHALRLRASFEKAHEGLSYVLGHLGENEKAAWHRRQAFQNRYIIPLPYRGRHTPVPVLMLSSTTGGNVHLQRFLHDQVFQTFVVLPEFYNVNTPLPKHQLVVNGIGDAEMSAGALRAARSLLALTAAPVLNSPAAVLATSRSNNASRLSFLPGVVTPLTVTLPRERLGSSEAATTLADHGFGFPLLLRAPGFHTGLHFLRVDNLEGLTAALAELPGPELIVMQYLDARGADGKTRKYRVMLVDGQIYPLHVAISSHWKIHYFTAEMADNPQHRAEDAAFLEDMPKVLGPLAMNALKQIQSTLALDYAGVDFGLNAQGELLLFEANATMVVNPPEPDERWKYRRPAYDEIRRAIHRMLLERSGAAQLRAPIMTAASA
jgi:glutamate/tyrosine decarboxylase-like PLP-dependent enzyme/glutathione synthase/RimK-type ligase-like ATP-grasp enzyme